MLRRRTLSCLIALLLAAQAVAHADKTDDVIRTQMKSQNIPGLSLAVIRDGVVVKAEGYGFANLAQTAPAKPDTVYKIASVSKQFIATGVMLLAQERLLSIGDPVGKYLEGTPPAWKPLTIRHLLTHTGGLVREAPAFDPPKLQSDADVIRSAYPLPLRFAPGDRWEYSNLGYFALAEIIRIVSGQPWNEYLSAKVFEPLGMTATFATHTRPNPPNRARGYTDNDKLLDAPDWPASRPSGAFYSTVLDLAKWDAALETDKILTAATRRQMWTPVTLTNGSSYPYGFGWQTDGLAGRPRVRHSGGLPGFRASFTRFVDDRLTIIALMNLDDVDIDAIMDGVAAAYLPASK